MTRQAAEAGKQVHSEKPFCRFVGEGVEASEAAEVTHSTNQGTDAPLYETRISTLLKRSSHPTWGLRETTLTLSEFSP